LLFELTSQDIMLLKCFRLLQTEGRKNLLDYLKFLAEKQYRAELSSRILNNPVLYNGLVQAHGMCEREDVSLEDILQKINQLKYMYYQLLEKTSIKYDDILDDLNQENVIRDWGRIGFENITEAAKTGRKDLILRELEEMIEGLKGLAKKGGQKRIIAV